MLISKTESIAKSIGIDYWQYFKPVLLTALMLQQTAICHLMF